MKKNLSSILLVISLFNSYGQNKDFQISSEFITKTSLLSYEKTSSVRFVGILQSKPVFLKRDRNTRIREAILLTEANYQTSKLLNFKRELAKFLTNHNVRDSAIFYSKYVYDIPDENGHSILNLSYKGETYRLDSIYHLDKKIHSSFSSDGRYLLVNTLNTLSDYYNPEQDNRIMVYDLSEIAQGKINKEHIPCIHCADSYLVNDQLFFTKGRKDGYDGFSNKDIYVAPWGSLKDSVKIASNTDIKAISPDGRYILGTRFWDRQKNTDIILNVTTKKYQMLLGRDYAERQVFYSHRQDKFAYDFKGYLIYVDLPKTYPFDALKWRNEEIPDWTEEEFWKAYQHPPLAK